MGNKSLTSPLPSTEQVSASLSVSDLSAIRRNFSVISQGNEVISHDSFLQLGKSSNSLYIRKNILPRLFHLFDSKKDGVIDLDEYTSAVALFRAGPIEEKIKFLYLMYDGNKSGGSLIKDNLKQLLVDATICMQKEDVPLDVLEGRIADLTLLSEGMVEAALLQYSSKAGKVDIQEFINFVRGEGTIQGLLKFITSLIDPE